MRFIFAIFVFVCFCVPPQVFGEFYRYRDETGALRFTDDISEVPEDQREAVRAYGESNGETPKTDEAVTAEGEGEQTEEGTDEAAKDEDEASNEARLEKLKAKKKQLENEKAALTQEYESLEKERAMLEAEKKKVNAIGKMDSKSATKTLDKKIDDLNERFHKYDDKKAAFLEKVKAYNNQSLE